MPRKINIKKFDDYTELVLVDGDFDEYDVDLDESIFNLSEYYGKFETIKTLHFKNWHTDDTFFPHKTLEEILNDVFYDSLQKSWEDKSTCLKPCSSTCSFNDSVRTSNYRVDVW